MYMENNTPLVSNNLGCQGYIQIIEFVTVFRRRMILLQIEECIAIYLIEM